MAIEIGGDARIGIARAGGRLPRPRFNHSNPLIPIELMTPTIAWRDFLNGALLAAGAAVMRFVPMHALRGGTADAREILPQRLLVRAKRGFEQLEPFRGELLGTSRVRSEKG